MMSRASSRLTEASRACGERKQLHVFVINESEMQHKRTFKAAAEVVMLIYHNVCGTFVYDTENAVHRVSDLLPGTLAMQSGAKCDTFCVQAFPRQQLEVWHTSLLQMYPSEQVQEDSSPTIRHSGKRNTGV